MELGKEDFDKVFEALGKGDVLLVSDEPITKDKDIYFADRVFVIESFGVKYLFYRSIVAQAYNYSRRDLLFVLSLFKDCKHWKLMSAKEYNKTLESFIKKDN